MENESFADKAIKFDISAFGLHVMAMVFMLSDHIWATFPMIGEWMTCMGRIAFPIYAFMLVEGFFHTHDLKKYFLRLFVFAVISEIPFNLIYGGMVFYPYHQNVIWTLMLGLGCIWVIEKAGNKGKKLIYIVVSFLTCIIGLILGYALMLDYYGIGVLTVLTFYFFRGRKWQCFLGQLLVLYYLNVEILGGYYYPVNILGHEFELIQQGFALLSLIPIWLYRGRQGHHGRIFQYFCYAFYPVHMLALVLISFLMTF